MCEFMTRVNLGPRSVNTDSNGFSTIQSVKHIQREVVRQGVESHSVHGHYSHG